MIADEVKIRSEFANKVEKLENKKKRLTCNVSVVEWKSLRKSEK